MKNVIQSPSENETLHSSGGRIHDHLNTGLGPLKLLDITQKSLDGLQGALSTIFILLGFQQLFLSPRAARKELSKTDPIKWALRCAVLLTFFRFGSGKSASLDIQVTASSKTFSFFPDCVLSLPSLPSTILAGIDLPKVLNSNEKTVMRNGREKALKH